MKNRLLIFSFVLTCLTLVSGCGGLRPKTDPALDDLARSLAVDIRSLNQEIESSKGTGWIRLETDNRRDLFNIAWAAMGPNRLRITFMVSGHPFETIVATGENVTFVSHTGEHEIHTTTSSDPDLKKFIQIPVKLSELIAILLGQIPVHAFDQAWFEGGIICPSPIALKQNWKPSMQKLYTSPEGEVQQLLFLDQNYSLIYDISYGEYQTFGENKIPVTLLIQDAMGRKIHINLTRFMPNAPIKETVFQLTETGS